MKKYFTFAKQLSNERKKAVMEKEDYKTQSEVMSRVLRAGKRTYFFDLKETKNKEHYLTITESKRRFDESKGTFFYEKHKIFLHIQDVDSFSKELNEVIAYVHSEENGIQTIKQKSQSESSEDEEE
ncbi:MAG TPA: DUF3276 family protein [Bacteroidales bacterium]|jgi:hypothetical protein|nr:PUR family DNA/RNA-binding protein [Bacteroidales bacterium]HOF16898.1 DUF3276 family protein [Bacteroidales bacterium]HON20645.1 DUF3276 family protein [Bacteroidales bacterium]HOR82693.1 DUF3276 family protein [Bacteroidales bacterium]HPJ91861.1 DUF3276 family protein [Bacteroidales bacterium]